MSESEFLKHNWEADEKWLEYKSKIEVPSDTNEAAVLDKLKRRYYQKFIDPNFGASSASSSTSTQSTSTGPTNTNNSTNYEPRRPPSSSNSIPRASNAASQFSKIPAPIRSIFQKISPFLPSSQTIWLSAHIFLVPHLTSSQLTSN
jgi:hypothetical protein